jgi:hypothetical protein
VTGGEVKWGGCDWMKGTLGVWVKTYTKLMRKKPVFTVLSRYTGFKSSSTIEVSLVLSFEREMLMTR